ncbi:erythromycin esterase family protein [Hymenobacter sp. B81]|uniref:erythromycin esterase family protein n=1 Tax=Hymenobacter sp. B81 TaxID=3344878 RepID=UPI0037DD75FB
MKTPHWLLTAALLALSARGAEAPAPEVQWLRARALPFDPATDHARDLRPLKAALADARVVVLGEPTHGDGTSFTAKTRLVKFLHQHMGFSVLAFESGGFSADQAWQQLAAGAEAAPVLAHSTMPLWTQARQCQPLLGYLAAQARGRRPLRFTGFDCRDDGPLAQQQLLPAFHRFLAAEKLAFADTAELGRFNRYFAALSGPPTPTPDPARSAYLRRHAADFRALLAGKLAQLAGRPGEPAEYWRQTWQTTLAYLPGLLRRRGAGELSGPAVSQLRDSLLAENLVWLLTRRFPRQKIIVWTTNYHAAHRRASRHADDQVQVMGDYLAPRLGRQLYTVGFTAGQGEWGLSTQPGQVTALPPAAAGSFEDWCRQAGLSTALVPLRSTGAPEQAFSMRPLGYQAQQRRWAEVFDAVVYTATMEPARPLTGGSQ